MATIEADVAILMPKITDNERFTLRYAGLSAELSSLGLYGCFTESHTSYDAETHGFTNVFDIERALLGETANVPLVRDLTMSIDDKPLYVDPFAPQVVHHPEANRFLANKANMYDAAPDIHPLTHVVTADMIRDVVDAIPGERVVVKPTSGSNSEGVQVLSKSEAVRGSYKQGTYLLQEYIDGRRGIPTLGIEGIHNLRIISIGGSAIAGIARVGGGNQDILDGDDEYGSFVDVDNLPATMHDIVDTVHDVLQTLPGEGRFVTAIDLMRGQNGSSEEVDVLCEVNRRPLRVSAYDIHQGGNRDNAAVLHMARLWDQAEAAMLAGQIG